jgi:hypothetical protein
MSSQLSHFKERIDETFEIIFPFRKPAAVLIFLWIGISSVEAQEYATDRLFMKEYSKAKCRNEVENKIRHLKNNRDMTLEHQEFLNQNIWSKLHTNLPLSRGEKKHLNDLKQKGIPQKKIRSKDYWAYNAAQFRSLRLKCK